MPASNETTAERIEPWWHGGRRTSANPCCSAIEPCSTQRAAPYAVCESCFRAAALAPESARPTAWMRRVYQPSTPNGPAERDVDLVYGDDQPDGEGWVPLYRAALAPTPAPEPVGVEAIEGAFDKAVGSAEWAGQMLGTYGSRDTENAGKHADQAYEEALSLIRKAIAQPAAQDVGEASASDEALVDAAMEIACTHGLMLAEDTADREPIVEERKQARTALLARLSRQPSASDNVDFLLTRLVEQQDEINRLRTVQQWDRRLLRLSRQPSAAAPRVEVPDDLRKLSDNAYQGDLAHMGMLMGESREQASANTQFASAACLWVRSLLAPPVPDRIATTPGEGE